MRSNNVRGLIALGCAVTLAGCGKAGNPPPVIKTTNGTSLPTLTGNNVLAITVNGSTCGNNFYPNKPCVSIKVCSPGSTTSCDTIKDILVDTGSSGLRVFKTLLATAVPTQVTVGGHPLAQCAQFADGSSQWGPVQNASVVLGGEPAVQIPIHVIDSTFTGAAANCAGADTSPAQAGINGILGVGIFGYDCGAPCTTEASNPIYFSCNGSSCSSTVVPLTSQVRNPVAALPQDNNGVIVELPLISTGGVPSMNGYLVLGIGTQTNNTPPAALNNFPTDATTGEFVSSVNSQNLPGFIDSGSNAYFFPTGPGLPDCGSTQPGNAGLYCPASLLNLTGIMIASGNSKAGTIDFQVGNFNALTGTPNNVFIEAGGNAASYFDWGLPFFMGRNVYVGIEGTSSSLGKGPNWAF